MLIDLEQQEWERVMALLLKVDAPWTITNPLIVKINKQMQEFGRPLVQPQKGNSDDVPAKSRPR